MVSEFKGSREDEEDGFKLRVSCQNKLPTRTFPVIPVLAGTTARERDEEKRGFPRFFALNLELLNHYYIQEMTMMDDAKIAEMDRKVEALREMVQDLIDSAGDVEAVKRNAKRILASVKMLEINICDVAATRV